MSDRQDKLESNAEYQRRKLTPESERKRQAVDIGVKNIVNHYRQIGQEVTESQARKKMINLAEEADKKQKKHD